MLPRSRMLPPPPVEVPCEASLHAPPPNLGVEAGAAIHGRGRAQRCCRRRLGLRGAGEERRRAYALHACAR
eukprot:13573247-Alexandrium_andersonii.AAC.1